MNRSIVLFTLFILFSLNAGADLTSPTTPIAEIERARKRLYNGGRDEEDLKVLGALPEFIRRTDERVIQKDVYKSLFNQDLVDDASSSSAAEAEEPETGH